MVELNLISKNQYTETIKKISKKEKNLFYCPHPREESKNFKEFEGIKFLQINGGLEYYFLNSEFLPKKIISFYSTALVSFSILFDNISINYIENNQLKNIKDVKRYYEYYKSVKKIHKYRFL